MSRGKIKDLSGIRSGKLKVIKYSHKLNKKHYFECICDCGNYCKVVSYRLLPTKKITNQTKSCGCLIGNVHLVSKTHGLSNTRIYGIWCNIKDRCNNTKNKKYHLYGGRGIKICDRWTYSFENFYEDMKDGYIKGITSIDRIDVNGNYEPTNCRWATAKVQQNNKRNTIFITCNGVTKSCANWAVDLGVSRHIIKGRYLKGLTHEDCLKFN